MEEVLKEIEKKYDGSLILQLVDDENSRKKVLTEVKKRNINKRLKFLIKNALNDGDTYI